MAFEDALAAVCFQGEDQFLVLTSGDELRAEGASALDVVEWAQQQPHPEKPRQPLVAAEALPSFAAEDVVVSGAGPSSKG